MTNNLHMTLELECGERILQNLDRQLKLTRHSDEKINRLLSMRQYVSTQVLQQTL